MQASAPVSANRSVLRGFQSIAEGQVHYRYAEPAGSTDSQPLVMIHASPGSSLQIAGLVAEFGKTRRVIAPDTLGNGDSCPPAMAVPEIGDFADALGRFLDAMGLDQCDLYGTHTGASIAMELTIARPDRVRKLVIDGMGLYAPEEQAEILRTYAPEITPDLNGSQFNWAWHFQRDQFLFWPWFQRDADHRRDTGLPEADDLHDMVVEILKSIRTYHHSYRAAFRHPKRHRLPLITRPCIAAGETDDMLYPYLDEVVSLIPGGRRLDLPGHARQRATAETVRLISGFLDE